MRFVQLRALGCGFAQGYLFGRPVAFADAVKVDPLRARQVVPGAPRQRG
jgi:EAL domain-containing protein (putative c-di-GMP-specific phosphodiesterase class I)